MINPNGSSEVVNDKTKIVDLQPSEGMMVNNNHQPVGEVIQSDDQSNLQDMNEANKLLNRFKL